jgi:hypothetical protein
MQLTLRRLRFNTTADLRFGLSQTKRLKKSCVWLCFACKGNDCKQLGFLTVRAAIVGFYAIIAREICGCGKTEPNITCLLLAKLEMTQLATSQFCTCCRT